MLYVINNDVSYKFNKFTYTCATRIAFDKKALEETQIKFYKEMASPILINNCKNLSPPIVSFFIFFSCLHQKVSQLKFSRIFLSCKINSRRFIHSIFYRLLLILTISRQTWLAWHSVQVAIGLECKTVSSGTATLSLSVFCRSS